MSQFLVTIGEWRCFRMHGYEILIMICLWLEEAIKECYRKCYKVVEV